jgi:hypothetical protein
MAEPDYCGRCGREMPIPLGLRLAMDPEWCADCEHHVLCGDLPPWERTYLG